VYPAKEARELAILLRISRELDIVGDVSAQIDNPSELIAWVAILRNPAVVAWRAEGSGHRYLQVTADHRRAPVRGRIAAVLACEQHREFWQALGLDDLRPRESRALTTAELRNAWDVMPITPLGREESPPEPPADESSESVAASADG